MIYAKVIGLNDLLTGIFFREPGADIDSYGMPVFQRFHSIMISKDLGKSSLIRIADTYNAGRQITDFVIGFAELASS